MHFLSLALLSLPLLTQSLSTKLSSRIHSQAQNLGLQRRNFLFVGTSLFFQTKSAKAASVDDNILSINNAAKDLRDLVHRISEFEKNLSLESNENSDPSLSLPRQVLNSEK